MINIYYNTTQTATFYLQPSLSTPVYLFSLLNLTTRERKNFIAPETSTVSDMLQFTITEVGTGLEDLLTGRVSINPFGRYTLEVYEQTSSTNLDLTLATILGDDELITHKQVIYDHPPIRNDISIDTTVCGAGVSVVVTDETVLGANDGTASATPSNVQGTASYLWSGPDSFTSTDQNIINLAPGTYTVVLTDDILPGCTAEDSGEVMAGEPSGDPDAEAFILAAGITDETQKTAIDNLVVDLKGFSLWDKIYYLYPMVGGTASTHSYNLIDPTLYQITWSGGVTHSSTGVTGNAANGYGDTGFNPNGIVDIDSFGLSSYIRTDTPLASVIDAGIRIGVDFCVLMILAGDIYTTINGLGAGGGQDPISNSDKLITSTRTNSTTTKSYRAALEVGSSSMSSTNIPNGNIFILARNNNGTASTYSDREHALDLAAEGLSAAEITNLNTAIETYQTALGRNV